MVKNLKFSDKKYRPGLLAASAVLIVVMQLPAFGQVTGLPDMPHPRVGMCSARIENTVYFIGGAQNLQGKTFEDIGGTRTVQAFNMETNTWEKNIAPLETPRVFACAVALDDSIYVMGGVDSLGNVLNSVEVYSPESNSWHYTSPMKYARKGAASTSYDGRVLVFGGGDTSNTLLKAVEAYDPENGGWKVLPDPTLFPRAFHHVARIGKYIYIFGGIGATVGPITFIERYVPLVGVESVGLTWKSPRAFFGTVVDNSIVYVISGYGQAPGGNPYFSDVEAFNFTNPDSVTERTVNVSLAMPRRGFVAARGSDGTIYIFGGVSQNYKNGLVPIPTVEQVRSVTAVQQIQNTIPTGFSLDQNYPNPFNPTTNIRFDVPSPGSKVSLNVYNMLGEKVQTLVDGYLHAGSYSAVFNGANLPSGAYIYRLETEKGSIYRKMALIK